MTTDESLWRRSTAWRWLVSLACVMTVAVLAAKPWQDAGSGYTPPMASFDVPQSVASQTSTPPTTSAASSPGNTASAVSFPPGATAPPGFTAGQFDAGASTDIQRTATVANMPPVKSSVVWSNASGSVSGGGLIAGTCCGGGSMVVVADKPVRSGKHYWELMLSVTPGKTAPGTWTNAGVLIPGDMSTMLQAAVTSMGPQMMGRQNDSGSAVSAILWNQGDRYRNGDVFMFALDADAHVLYFGVNGQWLNGTPGGGGGSPIGKPGSALVAFAKPYADSRSASPEGDRWIANFGATAYKYAMPIGYSAYGTFGPATRSTPTVALANPITGAPPAPVSGSAFVNRKFKNEVEVGGHPIPLPEGEWVGLALFRGAPGSAKGDAAILGRFEGNRLVQMVAVNAFKHDGTTRAGFPRFAACDRQDYLFLNGTANEAFGAQKCWWINHAESLWAEQAIFRAARGVAEQQGAAIPEVFLNVGYRRADDRGFVTTFYYFDPVTEGLQSTPGSWSSSDWSPANIAEQPRRAQYVEKLKEWGRDWAPIVFAYRASGAP